MAQSRKDKSRKKNLKNYKNQNSKQKKNSMSNLPERKPFRQVPTWSSTETFEIQGAELEALYNYFNIVAPAFTAIQQVFARGIQGGKIQIGYENEDGTPVDDNEVAEYTKALNAYFKDKLSKDGVDIETAEVAVAANPEAVAPAPTTGKILNMHGAPVTNEG